MKSALVSLALLPLATPAVATTMSEHEGFKGFWIKGPALEAFVAVEPMFRILSVRSPGSPTIMAGSALPHQGVRLAFMEPEQIPASFDPGDQPVEKWEATERGAWVRLRPAAGLRYTVRLELEEKSPRLRVEYELENMGPETRRVACWSLASFTREGKLVVPFGEQKRARRQLVLPWWSAWPRTGAAMGGETLVWDAWCDYEGDAAKVGVITGAGWCAYVLGEQAIVSLAEFVTAGEYPEDGANVSIFVGEEHAEIEQMSPLQELAPGEKARHAETFHCLPVPAEISREPDSLRTHLESQLEEPSILAHTP